MIESAGNPGNEGFYADFGERLLRNLLAREKRTGEKKMKYLFYSVGLSYTLLFIRASEPDHLIAFCPETVHLVLDGISYN